MNFNEELRLRRKKPIQESFDFNSVLDDDADDTVSMTYNSLGNKLFMYEASVIPILQDEMKIPSLRGWNLLNEPAHGWDIPYYWTQVHNINSSKGNKIWNTFISTGGINIQDYGIECVFDLYKDPSLNLSDWKEQFIKNPENDRDCPTMNAEDFKKCQDFVNIIPFQTFNKMFNECCKNMDYYRNKGRHIYFVINREGSAWLCLTYMSEYSVSWRCIVGLTGINTPSKCFLKDKAPEKSNGDTPEAKACRKFLNATAVAKIPMKTLQGEYVQLSDKRMAYVHRS